MSLVEFAATFSFGLLALFVGEAVVGVVGYLVIAVFSFGLVQGARPAETSQRFPWHGFLRVNSARWVVEPQVAGLIGTFVCVAVIALYVAWRAGAFGDA